ncbi:rhamnogalacturonan acetylesterase [Solirubrum puertoriconensis]|uniref:GntR family transcriptional regulator n=1 Tax=Solirubrum puertoriconensis TaxID=1751427 RepID=A0A9X0L3W0_SOLP1|nr:rhamnogalacturonan acetylesterase [Solirubrum puertoriconensis]KUG06953.1 GntR family transcriptional regulator [Solirubrum puertoriconensis]
MTTRLLSSLCLSALLLVAFVAPAPKKITVYLVGDSTMSTKEVKAYPETGWGTPFVAFFEPELVAVENHAQNGRSTRTFLQENRWQPIAQQLREGDYVLIQFGHNDEVPTKKSATTEADFQQNLLRYVTETRSKKATPVLITPVARRKFDEAGKVVGTHPYAELVRQVARANQVPLIDLEKSSEALLQQFGVEDSKLLFNQLAPGEHPNYPQGRDDNTHFSELGARKMAQLVLADIRALKLELANRVVQREVKVAVDPQAR